MADEIPLSLWWPKLLPSLCSALIIYMMSVFVIWFYSILFSLLCWLILYESELNISLSFINPEFGYLIFFTLMFCRQFCSKLTDPFNNTECSTTCSSASQFAQSLPARMWMRRLFLFSSRLSRSVGRMYCIFYNHRFCMEQQVKSICNTRTLLNLTVTH